MRVMDLHLVSDKKKLRGLRRKTRAMEADLVRLSSAFPAGEEEPGWGFWHLHLPVRQSFLDSPKTPFKVRRRCAQALIDAAARLAAARPRGVVTAPASQGTRVLAFIQLPGLWYSELMVFFDQDEWKGYFDRHNEYQTWLPLPAGRDIVKEWGLRLPPGFSVRGYRELLNDDGETYEDELWYLGELD